MDRITGLLILAITFTAIQCKADLTIEKNTALQQVGPSKADVSAFMEKQDRQLKLTVFLALIPVVVAFSFIVFIFYRARRESFFKQQETEFRLNIAELEMKVLRAQINPHFIFNCLNSIHHYMHQHELVHAGEYLIKFSQLIRYVLETSSSRMIALIDDLEALKIYLELEQLRVQRSFEFQIITHALLDIESICIPPMMIQPFVENSIWHGLNNTGSGGQINITINVNNDLLQCIIEDNGKRDQKKTEPVLTSTIKKTSMGMALIKDRLAVVSKIYDVKAEFRIEDRKNDPTPVEGTRIILLLPYDN